MIEVQSLSKRFGDKIAVDDVSFTVSPGHVTGFLGPNGSGKTTTMRMILDLVGPTSGYVRVNGRRYRDLKAPLREVGSLLDARSFHEGRTARQHLMSLARSNAIPRHRVDVVLELVGLTGVADRRVGRYSLGMGQRLGVAGALLGDPAVLMFDEPVNGLDTEGIRWLRDLMKGWAREGRTVFLSSHLMSEMQLTADRLAVIGRGRLLADTTVADFIATRSQAVTLVRTPQPAALMRVLTAAHAQVEPDGDGGLRVTGVAAAVIGDLAKNHGIGLHLLTPQLSSLEDVYTELTGASIEYRAGAR